MKNTFKLFLVLFALVLTTVAVTEKIYAKKLPTEPCSGGTRGSICYVTANGTFVYH